jgi:hypothetical protein
MASQPPLTAPMTFCRYCFARLPRGDGDFCNETCEDGMWAIVPTLDGEIYEPEPEEPPLDPAETGMPPARRCLELPPQPHEAAPFADREFIAGTRLRQHLIACNP